MDLYLTVDRTSPLRAQLERQLRDGIRSGQLRAGTLLPPSRALARDLRVSRGVVVDAYSQLVAEGYLSARRGHGTRVAATTGPQPGQGGPLETRERPIRYDLRPGRPDPALMPRRAWQAALTRAVRELPDSALGYGDGRGLPQLRSQLVEYLGRARGVVGDPQRLIVCAGLSHGLSLVWRALAKRGARRVAIEDPAWTKQASTVVEAGLEVVPIAVDDAGLVVERLDPLDVDAVAVTPAHHYPTGVVLAPQRRRALVEWARRRGAFIVEDDYDAEYRYDRDPVAAVQGLAPDCVVYTGTASKTLAPGLRLAWLLAPAELADEVATQSKRSAALPSVFEQGAFAKMLERGDFDRHLRRTRLIYRARRDALVEALAEHLPSARTGGTAAGLHVVVWLPERADETRLADAAASRGIALHTLHRDCAVRAVGPPALLLGYAALGEPALRRATRMLANTVALGGSRCGGD